MMLASLLKAIEVAVTVTNATMLMREHNGYLNTFGFLDRPTHHTFA